MKKVSAAMAILGLSIWYCLAIRMKPLAIPKPRLTAAEAIKKVEANLQWALDTENTRLISVQWCRADKFEGPRWISGRSWPDGGDSWFWFVTYASKEAGAEGFDKVLHCRIQGDGKVDVFLEPSI